MFLRFVWLSGLSAGLWNESSLVQFLIWAVAWVAGQWPGLRARCFSHTMFIYPSLFPSLFLSLKINTVFKIRKKEYCFSWGYRELIHWVFHFSFSVKRLSLVRLKNSTLKNLTIFVIMQASGAWWCCLWVWDFWGKIMLWTTRIVCLLLLLRYNHYARKFTF